MTIINTKTHEAHENVTFVKASSIIGLGRKAISRMAVKRMKDKTYFEQFNHFILYFNSKTYKKREMRMTSERPIKAGTVGQKAKKL